MEDCSVVIGEENSAVGMNTTVDVASGRLKEESLGVFHARKDSEVDNVFEDAISTTEHLQGPQINTDLKNVVEDELLFERNPNSLEVDDNCGVDSDGEDFQEAVGIPVKISSQQEEHPISVQEGGDNSSAVVREVPGGTSSANGLHSLEISCGDDDGVLDDGGGIGTEALINGVCDGGTTADGASDGVNGLSDNIQNAQGKKVISEIGNTSSNRDCITEVELETKDIRVCAEGAGIGETIEKLPSALKTPCDTPPCPAGLGHAALLPEPGARASQSSRANGSVSQTKSAVIPEPSTVAPEEVDETREKLQMIRVKFLRLANRFGQTPHNVVVAQVLYRLGLAEQLRGGNGGRVARFSFDRASAIAEQMEANGHEPLDFSCTIMVIGKTGVGKSSTINSIFDEVKFSTDAFQLGTKHVEDVTGTVHGINVRVIDTPGLLPSSSDQTHNAKILRSAKRFIRNTPPDIVLYLDRLDMLSREFGDLPLLRTITEIFGASIWFNAIVVLTHAASAPPEGPNGAVSSYDMFVTQRSHMVQQTIRQAAGDMRLMNPVSLVENHLACRMNRAGQRVLPNGQVWKPHLLLLSFASKILAEANTLLKLQDSPSGRGFGARSKAPPLPFLLSSFLQPRPQPEDDDVDESSDSDDELPPFKPLSRNELDKLSRDHRKAYFDELDYRERLLMKKQLREARNQRMMLKTVTEHGEPEEEEDYGGAASVPVPSPDLPLPVSFDSDNPTYRYRHLDSSNWFVRPVLDTHGWDHDVGYEGINVEKLFVVKDTVPVSVSGQLSKDKKDANLQMEVAGSCGKGTSFGLDVQTVGKDVACTVRGETRFSTFRCNKAAAGVSVTVLGDAVSAGVKVEDRVAIGKRVQVVVAGGGMSGRGEAAYGGSLEAALRDDLGRSVSTLGVSVMDWHGELAIGCNVQSQIPVGRWTNLIARASLNNRAAGQVAVKMNSSEQLQIVLIGLLPLFRKLFGYLQQMQYGQG